MNVCDERTDFTEFISSLSELAITEPATLLSAISFARFGPLKTPSVFSTFSVITSESGLNGFPKIPLVHEIR